MKVGMYIVAPEPISNVTLSVCRPFFVFYAVRVVSKESRRLVLPKTYCLLYE
jgi:hypothetical protein